MSSNELKPEDFEAFVERRKQAWRSQALQMSWEEKIAAIERMWARDYSLKLARTSLAEQAALQTSLAEQAARQTSLAEQAARQTSLAEQATNKSIAAM